MNQIITLSVILFFAACNNSKSKTTEKTTGTASIVQPTVLDNLVGTWQNEDGKSFEKWSKDAGNSYSSLGFSVTGTDTSWNEEGKTYPENGHWVFENLVKDQNDGRSVKFTSVIFDEHTVQFNNPEHDFPTDINYTLPDNNTIRAFIIGPNSKGGKDTIHFNFTRLK